MAERLVILSDLWGPRKGLWITSYLGYLQQYFDITYHDTSQLADLDLSHPTAQALTAAFADGVQNGRLRTCCPKKLDRPITSRFVQGEPWSGRQSKRVCLQNHFMLYLR